MYRPQLKAVLFALVTGCGNHPQNGVPADAPTNGCGTYVQAPSDAGCLPLCTAHNCPTYLCNQGANDAGVNVLQCYQDHTGRKPPGLLRARAKAGCAVGRFFAMSGHLEAASVPAFETLARDLVRFGAPAELRQHAERSAREERRHARLMSRLACRHGAEVPAVVVRATRPRSLEALARDNAIEGCVRETFGAALALHQSLHAADREVRAAMTSIAADELRHAELAWQLDDWLQKRLTAAARTRVAKARASAARALHRRELASTDSPLGQLLGLPARDRRCEVAAWVARGA